MQLVEGAGGDALNLVHVHEPGEEARPVRPRVVEDDAFGARAESALGHVEDAPEVHVVVRVDDGLQIGHGVLDLAAFVELGAADQLVRQSRVDERLLKGAGLRVGAVHDGHVRVGDRLLGVQARDLAGYPGRLLLRVVGRVADDRLALAERRPQLLRLASLVVGDDGVGRVEDGLRGAVVLFEHDGPRVGEILLEVLDVADVGAAERVDGLVGVAHHGDPRRAGSSGGGTGLYALRGRVRSSSSTLPRVDAGEFAHEHVLRVVGVLVLVNEDVAESVMVVLGHVRMVTQQFDGAHDQVVEVDGVGEREPMLVFGVDDRVQRLDVADGADLVAALAGFEVGRILGELRLDADELVLVVGDASEDGARRVAFDVDVEFGGDDLDESFGVGGVVDGESVGQSDGLAVAAQDAHTCGVEGGHPHALGDGADERFESFAHLGGRLVGEGDGEDLTGPCAEPAEDPCDAAGEHARLARAGARADEQRLPLVLHGLRLLRVEVADELVGASCDDVRILLHVAPSRSRGMLVPHFSAIHMYHSPASAASWRTAGGAMAHGQRRGVD